MTLEFKSELQFELKVKEMRQMEQAISLRRAAVSFGKWVSGTMLLFLLATASATAATSNKAYVVGSDRISGDPIMVVMDTTTNAVISTVALPADSWPPLGAVVSSDGSKVYVSSLLGAIYAFDATLSPPALLTPAPSHSGGVGSVRGLVLGNNGIVYLTGEVYDAVSAFNITTPGASAINIPVGTGPIGLSLSPDGSRLYVANKMGRSISVIDTASRTVTKTWSISGANGLMGILSVDTPVGERIYVSDQNAGQVYVLDSTGAVKATIGAPLYLPAALAVSPLDNSRVYVAGSGSSSQTAVWAIDTTTNAITTPAFASCPNGCSLGGAASISEDGKYLYASDVGTDGGKFYIFDVATGQVLSVASQLDAIEKPTGGGLSKFTTSPASPPALKRLVTVTKTLSGETGRYSSGTFKITVTCGGVAKVFNLAPNASDSLLVPEGTSCTVTEDSSTAVLNAATSRPTIVPSAFTVGGTGQNVSVDNELVQGTVAVAPVTVTKAITGDVALGHDTAALFSIAVNCTGATPKSVSITGGQSAVVYAEAGKACSIAEQSPLPDANTGYKYNPSVVPSTVTVAAGGVSSTVTNEVTESSVLMSTVTLTNTVTDMTGSGYVAGDTFTVTLNCGSNYTWTRAMEAGEAAIFSVRDGRSCTLSTAGSSRVLNAGYDWNHTHSPTNGAFTASGSVTAEAAHAVYRSGARTLTVKKQVTGDGKSAGYVTGGTFAVAVSCGGNPPTILQLADGSSGTVPVLLGDACTVSEASPATSVVRSGYSNTAVIAPSQFTVEEDQEVLVTNRIKSGVITEKGTLVVTKTVSGTSVGHNPTNLFRINVDCPSAALAEVRLRAGQSGSVEGQVGDSCLVTEPGIPTANSGFRYEPIISPSTVVIHAGETAVAVENAVVEWNKTYVPITVKKVTSGDVEGYGGNRLFAISVNCTNGIGSGAFQLGDGNTATYKTVAGDSCTVSETAVTPTGYESTTIITASGQGPVNAANASFTAGSSGSTVIVANSLKSTASNVRLVVKEYIVGGSAGSAYLFADVKFKVFVRCSSGYSAYKWVTNLASATFDLGATSESQNCEVSTVDASPATHLAGYAHTVMPGIFMVPSAGRFAAVSSWTTPR